MGVFVYRGWGGISMTLTRLCRLFGSLLLIIGSLSCSTLSSLNGPYPDPNTPGTVPLIFGAGVLSTGMNERDFTLSPDGRELYYTIMLPDRHGVIMKMERIKQTWQKPAVAAFSGTYSDIEPSFSPDGNRLYFASNRPLPGEESPADYNIWYMDRDDSDWSAPRPMGPPVQGEGNEFYPSVTRDGLLCVTAEYDSTIGGEDIFFFHLEGDKISGPHNPGTAINGEGPEFNAAVSPDGSFVLFSSYGRKDGLGGGDLYVSFRGEDGIWREAIHFDPPINSTSLDYCPSLTPDGKYLVFTSQRKAPGPKSPRISALSDVTGIYSQAGNGLGDLYWVSKAAIDQRNSP